jgi:hypothetical protein
MNVCNTTTRAAVDAKNATVNNQNAPSRTTAHTSATAIVYADGCGGWVPPSRDYRTWYLCDICADYLIQQSPDSIYDYLVPFP